jgi:hypothetical protein
MHLSKKSLSKFILLIFIPFHLICIEYESVYDNLIDVNNFFESDPQDKSSREEWIELNALKAVNLSQNFDLFSSGLLAVNNNSIMVYDYQHKSLFQFDYEFNLIGEYGREGRGPEEFLNPTDLISDDSGYFWIVDGRNSRITKWSDNGDLVFEQPVPSGLVPHRFAPMSEEMFVLFSLMGQSSMHTVDMEGDVQKSFLSFSGRNFSNKGLLLDGQISAKDDRIYYAGTRNDLIKAYSKDGSQIYSRRVINPVNKEVENLNDNQLRSAPHSVLDIQVFDDQLYILYGGAMDDPNRWRYLDVYDKSNGDYSHTFLLESFSRKFSINRFENGEIYLTVLGYYQNTRDRALSIYKLTE